MEHGLLGASRGGVARPWPSGGRGFAAVPVSPWLEHINLTGDYLWRSSEKIGGGRFRPPEFDTYGT